MVLAGYFLGGVVERAFNIKLEDHIEKSRHRRRLFIAAAAADRILKITFWQKGTRRRGLT